jgi:uncharacterized protein YcbX
VQVVELWRFPVKSFQGQQLDTAEIGPDGIVGDRAYALFDLDTGFGLTARRVPELLHASARLVDGDLLITLPDGSESTDHRVLSDWLGRKVALCRAGGIDAPRYENPLDFEHDRDWIVFEGPAGAFHDSRRAQVSLVSTGTLDGWDRRRFRANVVLDGDGEDSWVGSSITLGDAHLDVGTRIDRCVMTTRPQPGGIDRDLDVLRSINHTRDGCLAVGALVATPGRVKVGDAVAPV